MALYRLPFAAESGWTLGPGNWDDPGGHGSQFYAFDFGHAEGGDVRAARAGRVIATVNDLSINTSTLPADHPDIMKFGAGNYVWVRHADDTVAVYLHLKKGSVSVAKEQWVPQGLSLGKSGNTGHSFGPHLHFEVVLWANAPGDAGPSVPIHVEDKNHLSPSNPWRPRSGDVLASNNTSARQDAWRWCAKCQGLFFSGNSGSKCPSGAAHDSARSGNYCLTLTPPVPSGYQKDWRWCSKCQGMFFAGNPGSKCPGGGEHANNGSGDYGLPHNVSDQPGFQADWRFCTKCKGLFFGGNGGSKCPADGAAHSQAGSGNYSLAVTSPEELQRGWRRCGKCQGLFFAANPSSKCPGGGAHSETSAKYVLLQHSPSGPGQQGWCWCDKCQGLFFGDNPGSKCPAGGAHSKAQSAKYVLVHNAESGPGEKGWRWCSKCQGLFWGEASSSKCPADGTAHHKSGGEYRLIR